jgi:hypothetical protein
MIAPMMIKIHKAIPASLKLIPLAYAGVAIPARSGMNNPTIIPANQGFLPFNIPHSPFFILWVQFKYCISYANVKPKTKFDLFI